jgi:hypothetical protein
MAFESGSVVSRAVSLPVAALEHQNAGLGRGSVFMVSEIVGLDSGDAAPDPSREIEFALMLSRVIDSVEKNPEFLRATIYELARHKLKEEFASECFGDMRHLSKALEIAIVGVEAFNKKKDGSEASLLGANPAQGKALISAFPTNPYVVSALESVSPVFTAHVFGSGGAPARKKPFRSRTAKWSVAFLVTGLAVLTVAISLELFRKQLNHVAHQSATILAKTNTAAPALSAPTAVEQKSAEPSPTVPTAFGIYAVSDGKLHELDVLPGRAPDPRIAISSIITGKSRTTLPDGHVAFVIYRRDSATNAADRAEVRVVARIQREANFNKDGKQVISAVDENWVIRNISMPYRTAPKKDNPDMYEVRSENPDAPLPPGRYALVLKGLAYDFSVAGPITDPRQCLEGLVATNGRFYSECKK